jgi:hypothetical protein
MSPQKEPTGEEIQALTHVADAMSLSLLFSLERRA